MHSPGINGEGELREQSANPGSPGKWPLKRSMNVCEVVNDLALLCHSFNHMQEKTHSLEAIASSMGLRINKDKSKIMKMMTDCLMAFYPVD